MSLPDILTVSDLSLAIKKQLESYFPAVAVQGEISNLKIQSSGHIYFTLKDAASQIAAVLFRGNAQTLTRIPKDGDQVILRGELSLYPPRGNYQIIVRELKYTGIGELLLKLHELKVKLSQRGWFDPSHKKKIPRYPKTIGVITSPTGAVIQDILQVLTRRCMGFHLILNPVKVQGEGAAQEIAQAIDQFNRHSLADLLIVGRGGGSLEDLWAFNEEVVAEAIFKSRIPIISAVGHETDTSLADFVADLRAPTPTAAAEMATVETQQQLQFLHRARSQLHYATTTALNEHKTTVLRFKKNPFLQSPYSLLGMHFQKLDDWKIDLQRSALQLLDRHRLKLSGMQRHLQVLSPSQKMTILRQRLNQLIAHLHSLDPKQILKKGYTILFQENSRSVILSSKDLQPTQSVQILMHDGQVSATIKDIL